MYYRLNKKYSLRGWEKLPYAIVDNEVHAATFVNKTAFDALELCNGQIDLDLPLISNDIRRMVGKLEEQGIISPCSPGESIAEHQKYRRYPNRYMQMVHWSITGCCNSKCLSINFNCHLCCSPDWITIYFDYLTGNACNITIGFYVVCLYQRS